MSQRMVAGNQCRVDAKYTLLLCFHHGEQLDDLLFSAAAAMSSAVILRCLDGHVDGDEEAEGGWRSRLVGRVVASGCRAGRIGFGIPGLSVLSIAVEVETLVVISMRMGSWWCC